MVTMNPSADPSNAIRNVSPPVGSRGLVGWMRANLFSGWINTAVTLAMAYLIVRWGLGFIDWAFINAVWSVPENNTRACREVLGVGACWAVIEEKHRFILFGTYPYEEQWRPAVACLLFVALYVVSAIQRFWNRNLLIIWAVGLAAIGVLMWGGVLGMTFVRQESWGGLPITLILSTFGILGAFPLAILLALGRRSSNLPVIKILCVLFIEIIRGVPLISLLFMSSVMFPLFMPDGLNIDKLLRAQIAIILFASAYLAEVIRGGLQSIPKGQYEAADAIGLGYWQATLFIILPQALRIVIPPLVNTFIGLFKDTSLVLIIGLFDIMSATKAAIVGPNWISFAVEAYIAVATLYFFFCFAMSKYSQKLEVDLNRGMRR